LQRQSPPSTAPPSRPRLPQRPAVVIDDSDFDDEEISLRESERPQGKTEVIVTQTESSQPEPEFNPVLAYYWAHLLIDPVIIFFILADPVFHIKLPIPPSMADGIGKAVFAWVGITALVDSRMRGFVFWAFRQGLGIGMSVLSAGLVAVLAAAFVLAYVVMYGIAILLAIVWINALVVILGARQPAQEM
jgi:hypothetical protein